MTTWLEQGWVLSGIAIGAVAAVLQIAWLALAGDSCPTCGAKHPKGTFGYGGVGVSSRSHGRPYFYAGIGRRF